jgi:16S rRNA (guanine966-N2)-methyltransferase
VRIISGKYRGKIIIAPASLPVRPTTDYAKTGLFNILNNLVDYESISVLDLFSGTGNITYELISRGCTDITSVDIDKNCVKFISETASKLIAAEVKIIKGDAFQFISNCFRAFDVIFADPPFDLTKAALLPEMIFENNLLNPNGIFIFEHVSGIDYSANKYFSEVRKYGHVSFSFFRFNK